MRVCILTRDDLFPTDHGAAVRIVRTAEHLSRLGDPAFVVTGDRDRYYRFVDGSAQVAEYRPRPRAAEEWPPLPALGRWSERLVRRLGYPEEEVFLYRPMFDPAWVVRALAVARVEGATVFQAEFPGFGVPAAIAARALRTAGRPARSSIVQHNVEWDRLAEFGHDVRLVRRAEMAALSLVDEVVAVSADDRRRMVAAGLDPAKVTVVPHGVDVAAFAKAGGEGIRARYGIAPGAPLLFFHGTLHYWPNTEAVRFIAETLLPAIGLPGVRVLVAGRNPPRYYDHPAIVFTGPVDDLADHVAAADVCLCPLTAGGGTRLKLLEYMAAGRAIVSTPKGAEGIPASSGRDLVIADCGAPFVEAVARLVDRPDERRALGAAAARFARAYDWSRVAEALLALYRGEERGTDWNLRFSARPLTLLLLLNRGCNLRCSFCDLWDAPARLPDDRLLPLLDDAVAIGTRTVVLTGGEPFLLPGLFDAIAACRARGLSVNVTTNGTRVEARWDELIAQPPDSLSFSVDGLEATHDRLRGRKGAWRATIAALDRVVARGRPAASVYFTATRENVGELVAVWEMARARGAGFAFWPVNEAPAHYVRTADERAAWSAAVAEIAAREPAVAARRAFYEGALDYHAGALAGVRLRCTGFADQYGITWKGDLLPCCVWGADGLAVGNVFETPLRELWWSPAVRGARDALEAEGCAAGCYNHSLYEYTEATGASFVAGGGR